MGEIKEERLPEELKNANISLMLASYNDIFSSFDARTYSEKALSDDFLIECKKAARDKDDKFELIMSLPKALRSLNDEAKIRRRLKEHFKKHFSQEEKNVTKIKRQGIKWIAVGFIAIIAAVLIGMLKDNVWLNSLVEPVLVIPGWFAIWEGLTRIFIKAGEMTPDYEFYKKMTDVTITFKGY